MCKLSHLTKLLYLLPILLLSLITGINNSISENIDDQVSEISSLLMCPVCQGQSVAESNSDLAKDMRSIIRKKVQEGESQEEIISYFVNRYGDSILGSPPAKGVNWLLWLLPLFSLIFGGLGMGLFIYRSRETRIRNKNLSDEKSIPNETEYFDKIDKDLKDIES
ncbi:cytochrome c-type biogenesis protein CcmH [Desulfobacterota bacterium AH_259_B03_O07]|nr:cytochrome c-type biogenesis protein CcmH [Desulfobacterota bacterium AH_259_B03_O07]